MIVFIAKYPNFEEYKEGMAQRIISIDEGLEKKERIYLDLSFRKHWKMNLTKENNVNILHLNSLVHIFYLISYLLKAEYIYVHSIFNFFRIIHLFPLLLKKKIILDLHGVVPEEMEYESTFLKSKLFTFIELLAVMCSKRIICVTDAMKVYIEKKYFYLNKKSYLVLPIINELDDNIDINLLNKIQTKYGINDLDIVIIYVGNIQKWQNIDLMMKLVKKNEYVNNLKYIFLTNEVKEMKSLAKSYDIIVDKNIYIETAAKNELATYYSLSNYGLILRDEHILNKVSNPTKLSEYLNFGIIPIVLYDDIGDYKTLEYDFIKIDSIKNNLSDFTKKRSDKNKQIISLLKDKFLKNRSIIFQEEIL